MSGARESSVDLCCVAEMPREHYIIGCQWPKNRRSRLDCSRDVDDGRKIFNINLNLLGSIDSLCKSFSHNHSHLFPYIANAVTCQDGTWSIDRHVHWEARDWQVRNRANTSGMNILASKYAEHTRHTLRTCDINGAHNAVGVCRAHEKCICLVRNIDVARKTASAGNNPNISPPVHRLRSSNHLRSIFYRLQLTSANEATATSEEYPLGRSHVS